MGVMNRSNTKRTALLAAWLAIGFVGCAKDEDTAKVTGKVTIDGELLERGTVAFHPVGAGKIAYGQIRPDGSYSLRVGRGPGGLPPGEYRVLVAARMDPMHGISEGGGPPDPGAPLTPARYADSKKTPLKKTVSDGDNVINLELEWTEEDRARAAAAAAAAEEKEADETDADETDAPAEATAEDEPSEEAADEATDEDADAAADEDPASEADEGDEGEATDDDELPDAGEPTMEEEPASDDQPAEPGDETPDGQGESDSSDSGEASSEDEGS